MHINYAIYQTIKYSHDEINYDVTYCGQHMEQWLLRVDCTHKHLHDVNDSPELAV